MNGQVENLKTSEFVRSAKVRIGTKKGRNVPVEIGMSFGFVVVVEDVSENNKHRKYLVECLSCGRRFVMHKNNILRHSKSSSKGCSSCWHKDFKHGLNSHPLFKTWEGMIRRCYNPKHEAYNRYGGRGIVICDDWKLNPASFIDWAEKNNLRKGLQVDRKDNDLGYSPDNCRVVTSSENMKNTSANVMVEYNGEKVSLSEASALCGIKYTTLRYRLLSGKGKDIFSNSRW